MNRKEDRITVEAFARKIGRTKQSIYNRIKSGTIDYPSPFKRVEKIGKTLVVVIDRENN